MLLVSLGRAPRRRSSAALLLAALLTCPLASSWRLRRQKPLQDAKAEWGPAQALAKHHAQKHLTVGGSSLGHKPYHIVYNVESSSYFGWQARASWNTFRKTMADLPYANYTRLLTMSSLEKDDLASYIPTFVVKRDLPLQVRALNAKRWLLTFNLQLSRRYAPINKPHALTKWLQSPDGPKEDVIAIVDPDCFFTSDIGPWADKVKEGHAIGQAAYYEYNAASLQEVFKHYCKNNCAMKADPTGVPYLVHRKDMAKIAPLWMEYTIRMFNDMQGDSRIAKVVKDMGGAWCAEMFAYNVAAAELGISHHVVHDLQRRDVDFKVWPPSNFNEPIIHIGRAWFPRSFKEGKKWWTTWASDYRQWSSSSMGEQVWVKSNWTSGFVVPWPLPPRLDHVSRFTLTALQEANKELPPMPHDSKYRRSGEFGYYAQYGF